MRLIDADALMLTFNDWWYSSFGQEENEQSLTIKEAMKAIETAPTVDAAEVIKKMLEDATEAFFEKNEHLIDKWVLGAAEDEIEDAPTMEIERHGTWTERYMEDDECRFTRHRWYCSECGKWQTYGKSKYCLNCGAKMDGERKEPSDEEK